MKRLERFEKFVSVEGALLAAFFGNKADELLKSLHLPFALHATLAFAVIAIVYVVIGEGASYAVQSSRWIRRLIMGGHFVEGTWMDIVRNGAEITNVGILRISYEDGELKVSGENYTPVGILQSSFHSSLLELSWPLLQFIGSSDRVGATNSYSEIRFLPRDGRPLRYKGFFNDLNGKRFDYAGWKLRNVRLCSRLDDPMEVRKVVAELVVAHTVEPREDKATAA